VRAVHLHIHSILAYAYHRVLLCSTAPTKVRSTNLPGAAAPGVIIPCSSLVHYHLQKLYHNFSNRAAGRTCRLLVFEEVYLTRSFLLEFILERVYRYCIYIFLCQTVPSVYRLSLVERRRRDAYRCGNSSSSLVSSCDLLSLALWKKSDQ